MLKDCVFFILSLLKFKKHFNDQANDVGHLFTVLGPAFDSISRYLSIFNGFAIIGALILLPCRLDIPFHLIEMYSISLSNGLAKITFMLIVDLIHGSFMLVNLVNDHLIHNCDFAALL